MEPLAPIIDRMRELAQQELPSPRSCRVRLWDDHTFDALIRHSMGEDEVQCIRYERTTSEIVWEHRIGARFKKIPLSGGETIHEPAVDDIEVRVLDTVEPPY